MKDHLAANEEAIERPMGMTAASSDPAKIENQEILRRSGIYLHTRWTDIHHSLIGPKIRTR